MNRNLATITFGYLKNKKKYQILSIVSYDTLNKKHPDFFKILTFNKYFEADVDRNYIPNKEISKTGLSLSLSHIKYIYRFRKYNLNIYYIYSIITVSAKYGNLDTIKWVLKNIFNNDYEDMNRILKKNYYDFIYDALLRNKFHIIRWVFIKEMKSAFIDNSLLYSIPLLSNFITAAIDGNKTYIANYMIKKYKTYLKKIYHYSDRKIYIRKEMTILHDKIEEYCSKNRLFIDIRNLD